ncbi:TPA: DJ-1/PfpI family protein [Vibrio parahaemolyticus]
MSKRAAILLADGFEDAEAVIIIDILRRLDIIVDTVSCESSLSVTGYFKLSVNTDKHITHCTNELYDAVIIPGGPIGTQRLSECSEAIQWIKKHNQNECWIGAICSASVRVLGTNHLLKGRNYVCSGDLWKHCSDGEYIDRNVVEDGNLITGRSLGKAFDFSLHLASKILGDSHPSKSQAEHIDYEFRNKPCQSMYNHLLKRC